MCFGGGEESIREGENALKGNSQSSDLKETERRREGMLKRRMSKFPVQGREGRRKGGGEEKDNTKKRATKRWI